MAFSAIQEPNTAVIEPHSCSSGLWGTAFDFLLVQFLVTLDERFELFFVNVGVENGFVFSILSRLRVTVS